MAYFNRFDKLVKQLDKANITSNKIELLTQALYMFKESWDLDQALVDSHSQPEQDKMRVNAKEHFNK